jgi:3-oxoadipate enol-lactonase / 4-carboxymuconolactone decarboxylase
MNFASVNDINIHYEYLKYPRAGDAHVFLFINSLGTDLRIWDGVVNELKQYGSTLRFDKMGHGLSEVSDRNYKIADYAEDIIGLLDALNIDKVVLTGLSIGGVIAQYMAINHPERIEKLVISNSAPKVGTFESWETRINKVKTGGVSSIANDILKVWFSKSFHANRQPELAGYRAMLCNTNTEGYIKACWALQDNDLTDQVQSIKSATLLMAGSEDGSVSTEMVRETAKKIPGAEFIEIEGVGHISCAEQPLTVAALILKFVNNNSTGTPQSLYETGMKTRRNVLGDEHVDTAEANKTDFDKDFQEYITNSAWGSIWSRPGLTKRERSLITIAILAALKLDIELALHIKATRNTGASPDDVKEVLMHTGVYAGFPVTNSAMKIAKEIFSKNEDGDRNKG